MWVSPGVVSGAGLKKAAFIPQWVPQAQFAGYNIALDKGFYRQHGLDLTIIAGGPVVQSAELLTNGQAQFGTLWLCTGIELCDRGVELVNIAQMVQRSALMLVAKKSSGIRTPQDMQGRKIGVWGPIFQLQPKALFKKFGLSVVLVPQSFSVNLFLRDGVDVASAMWYNEYHTLLNAGLDPDELVAFHFHDYGLNFPEDGIYAMGKTCARDPSLCRAFVAASIEGWRYAFAHPEEAIDIVMRNLAAAHVPATRVHQKWMLNCMKDLIMPVPGGDTQIGRLDPEDYQRVAANLRENNLIRTIPSWSLFYKDFTADAAK